MIDFRYHLVSLVSVFLALAVGIVLGAGPLKGQIGDTLTNSVEQLRQEKDQLHDEVATANTSIANRDAFLNQVTPELVSDLLTGRSVVLIGLSGVDSKTVGAMADAIDTAGGTVTGQVSVSDTWVESDGATAREKALTRLAQKLPATSQVSGDSTNRLDTYLARSLVGTGDTGSLARGDGNAPIVLDALKSNDLIDVKGDLTALAGTAVVLAPAVTATSGSSNPTPTSVGVAPYVRLVRTLDATGGGTVVTGPASSATTGGLVSLIRKDDAAAKVVSTVDTGTTQVGVITTVAAVREQASGGVGQYGFGAGASAILPAGVTTSTTTGAGAG